MCIKLINFNLTIQLKEVWVRLWVLYSNSAINHYVVIIKFYKEVFIVSVKFCVHIHYGPQHLHSIMANSDMAKRAQGIQSKYSHEKFLENYSSTEPGHSVHQGWLKSAILGRVSSYKQATGMTKISRGGVFSKNFRPEGAFFRKFPILTGSRVFQPY